MGILSFFDRRDKTKIAILDTGNEFEPQFIAGESHSWGNDITRFPIESGGEITDHIEASQDEYTLNGIVSDAPISLFDLASSGVRSIGAGTLSFEKKTQKAVDYFRDLRDQKSVVQITSKFYEYDSMLCKSVSIDRGAGSGERITYTVKFTEAQFADTQLTSLGDLSKVSKGPTGAVKKTGAGSLQKNVGKKAGTGASSSASASADSVSSAWG